jgi:xanthine dehydrogenase YagR molybdenum-binding subunit
MAQAVVGKPIDRVDGRLKVTGAARYSTEPPAAGLTHGVIVQSTVARGEIKSIDVDSAMKLPGVIAVVTHANAPPIKPPTPNFATGGIFAEGRLPLVDAKVLHAGQHIAVVVARTLEQAQFAARMLKVEYESQTPVLSMDDPAAKTVEPPQMFGDALQETRGDVQAALANPGAVTVEATYTTPAEVHNPMEPSGTTAVWEQDKLTVYDSTQWVSGTQAVLAEAFGIPRSNVRVICPFIGGGFGCKGFIWPHTLLAAMAAKAAGSPVKLVLTRQQMFSSCGHRPPTRQTMTLAADSNGKLSAIRHIVHTRANEISMFVETCAVGTSRITYAAPAVEFKHRVTHVNIAQPTFMRAPGEASGTFALESAIDELAYKLNADPVELRLRNLPKGKNPHNGLPWSSYHADECLRTAADKFGWARRDPKPGSMRDGRYRVGYGVALASFPGIKFGGACRIRLFAEGNALVSTSAHDLGTGAYTVFTQIAADELGLPTEKVKVELGDSNLPMGPLAGGSNSTATVSHMIHNAAEDLRKKLAVMAITDAQSPLNGLKVEGVRVEGQFVVSADGSNRVAVGELIGRSGKPAVEANGMTMPGPENFAFHSFGAQFVEVAIDELNPRVVVRRVVSMFDAGRIVNPKTAWSQLAGGIVWGIGMALTEEAHWDDRTGRCVNDNFADYAIAVNADMPPTLEVMWTDKPDPHLNPLGVRGIGEIGITGVAAAIANAVYHATGKRVRELPITPEKLL